MFGDKQKDALGNSYSNKPVFKDQRTKFSSNSIMIEDFEESHRSGKSREMKTNPTFGKISTSERDYSSN